MLLCINLTATGEEVHGMNVKDDSYRNTLATQCNKKRKTEDNDMKESR